MKKVYVGKESSGKSLKLSKIAEQVRRRNIRWLQKTGVPRTMAFNQPMSPDFRVLIENSGIKYLEFRDLIDILKLRDADIFIDEVIKYFPASGSMPLTREQLDFLTQGAKSGVHIYAASQDFSQVHKQFRLLVNEVYVIHKILGSPRPMLSAPPVKMIWGFCFIQAVAPASFKGDTATMEKVDWIPSVMLIEEVDTKRFDTTYKVPLTKLPTKIVRRQDIVGYDEEGKIAHQRTTWI